eukprot:758757-Rhodomonas_salina.2
MSVREDAQQMRAGMLPEANLASSKTESCCGSAVDFRSAITNVSIAAKDSGAAILNLSTAARKDTATSIRTKEQTCRPRQKWP